MKSRARKRPRVPTNPVAATALKVDPTRTLTLRRGVCTEVSKRLAKVRLQIHDLLVRQQALRFRWATLPTEGKVAAVTNWVTTLLREALLPSGNWWAGKLLAAYMRGASRSHDDVRRRNPQLAALGAGGKGEFLRGLVRRRALPRPVTNAYNPQQPRDHKGKWSAEGKVGGFGTGRNTSDHWFEDSRGAINVTVENHTAATKAMNDMALKINDGDYLGLKDFNAAWGTYNLLYDAYWTGRSNSLYASRELRLVLQNPTNNHLNYVRTLHGNASAGFSNAARYALLYHQSDEIKSLRKLLLENAALHHDAAEALVSNAYNPQQPREEHTGKWVKLSDAVVGQPRDKPLRGHDHPDLELQQASEGAKDATDRAVEATLALLKYRFPNDAELRREYWESMFRGIETFAPWLRQQYAVSVRRGAKHTLDRSVQAQAGMAAGNVRQAMYEGRTSPVAASQHTLAKKYHDYLARAISYQGRMWLVSSIKDHNVKEMVNKRLDEVVKRHQEAAALHHDAAEMVGGGPVGNAYNPDQPRDEAGRWERLSDSAHRPYGSHPQERANRKPTQSPLEEGLEAGLEASNLSRHLHRLTEEFLDRVLADEGLDHAHQTAHSVRQTTTWIRPQAETTDHFRRLVERQGELAQHEKERYAGEHQELAHIHHGHASKLHGRAAYELGYLGRALGERGQGTAKDLIKRHREAAALHHDAAEMLDNTRPVANATPYVSPDDVETYGGRLQALAHRLRNELDGVTWAAAQRIARVLHDGLDQGWGAERLAQAITDAVDSIARSRALLIANTELIRAHADGQLDALEELGEEEVTAAVEWATAGDDRVCKLCKPLDGVVLTVAEARGLIPRHVNCRCAWLPAGTRKGQEGKVMQSTLQDVTRAVKRSLRRAPANDGWFEGKAVARKRPKV